ncbi:MAG TPA: hypothetical protein VK658_07700 [Chryseolinea sp.]|nr:hypothetical protein [Chryseolinea sp.]
MSDHKTVRFVYLVPSDSTIKPAYTLSIKNAAHHLQQWYRDQLGGDLSFSLSEEVVEVYKTSHPSSWYASNPDADWAGEWKFWFNVVNDAFTMTGGSFEDADNFWIIYIDALPTCPMQQGGGLNGVAAMGANDLRGLLGQSWLPICNEVVPNYSSCRYVGGLGHELGHAFGLPHPSGCDDGQPVACDYGALMFTGYIDYPNTHFSESEKAVLRASPFVTRMSGSACPIDCGALNLVYTLSSTHHVSICQGAGYFAGGKLQNTAGTYFDRLKSKGGCDSVVTTYLTVLPTYASIRNVSICQGETFLAGGVMQTRAGTYLDVFVSKNGCDSVVTTHLAVLPTYSLIKDVSICQGQTYFAAGSLRSTSGSYRDSFHSKRGCDSVITTRLKVLPIYESTRDVSICTGDSYVVAGIPQSTAGLYRHVLSTRAGCDSIVVINLKVLAALSFTRDISLCQGEHYFAGGSMQSKTGTYTDVFETRAGCDSVITTHLAVSPKFEITKDVSICSGEVYHAGGALQTNPGIYTDTYRSSFGCDSVVTVCLSVSLAYTDTVEVNTCDGEPYLAGGSFQTSSGIYLDLFTSKAGCDSIVVTSLVVGICTAAAPTENSETSIYPVPSQGSVYILAGKFHHAVLLNNVGQNMFITNSDYLDFGELPNGTYYVKIYEDPKHYVIRKVVLTR